MKKVIIIGATSGIGAALARKMHDEGYYVGITGRRKERLTEIADQLGGERIEICEMDVTDFDDSIESLSGMVDKMGGLDVFVYNSGIGEIYPSRERELKIMDTNARGFLNLFRWAFDYFKEKGGGDLVGISSIMKIRGYRKTAAYCATKAFMSSYMQGIRHISDTKNLGINVIDIRPGFVATEMTEKNRGMFWIAPSDKAADQIYRSIKKKKKVSYITKRWNLIAPIFQFSPTWLYNKV